MDKPDQFPFNENDPSDHDCSFELLVLRHLFGECSSEEHQSLVRQLREDIRNQEIFSELSLQIGLLSEMSLIEKGAGIEIKGSDTESPLPQANSIMQVPVTEELLQNPLGKLFPLSFFQPSSLIALVIIGALLTGGALGWILGSLSQKSTPLAGSERLGNFADNKAQSVIHPVAYLDSETGCDWTTSSSNLTGVGGGVQVGDEIVLCEGIASFRLAARDVLLSVEGPATLIITSPNSAVLQQGKVTAHVPWNGSEFSLIAGSYRLKTNNGEFGAEVNGNTTAVHVFGGEITTVNAPLPLTKANGRVGKDDLDIENVPNPLPIVIGENRAVELTTGSDSTVATRYFDADRTHFATKLSMSGRLPITTRYINAVKKSRPTGYWRFEAVESGEIRNEITNGTSLAVTTGLSLPGDQSNHVLEVGQSYERGNLVSVGTMDALAKRDYSVEVWMKPSHHHYGFLVSIAEQQLDRFDEQLESKTFLMILQPERYPKSPGTIRCANRNPLGFSSHDCWSDELYHLRRWQHVVAVKGKSTLVLYLDGKIVGSSKGSKPMLPGMHLVVGRPYPSSPQSSFYGQLDELSVYDHALTAEEIKLHFNAVESEFASKPGL
jgi:hypothetical protein